MLGILSFFEGYHAEYFIVSANVIRPSHKTVARLQPNVARLS